MQAEDIINRIDSFPIEFKPIKDIALARINSSCRIDANGTIELEKSQELFAEAYNLRLFAASSVKAIEKFHDINTIKIPSIYQHFLLNINGMCYKVLVLYGLPDSMYTRSISLLDRSSIQPLDLGAANRYWRLEYIMADSDSFHFGSYMQDDYVSGYFMTRKGSIQKIKPKLLDGKPKKLLSTKKEIEAYNCISGELLDEWTDFTMFLNSEINQVGKNN